MRELNVNEVQEVNGGTNYGAEFVGGCVAGVAGAAVATGGMSLPLAGQTCIAGGTITVLGVVIKELFNSITE